MSPLDDDCQEDRRVDGWRPQQATRPNTGKEDDDDEYMFPLFFTGVPCNTERRINTENVWDSSFLPS
jgi:hypothetical protein